MTWRRRLAGMLACLAAVVGIGLVPAASPASAQAHPDSFCWGSDWVFFHAGQFELDSPNGYQVDFQGDGNLVVYYLGHAIWASGTQGTNYTKLLWFVPSGSIRIGDASSPRTYKFFGGNTSTAYHLLIMQTDGNLVEYDTADCRSGTSPVWATGTVGKK